MFTKACEYGIRACIFVAINSKEKKRVSLKDIAAAIDSPEYFTAKILQKLAKGKIIYSVQGAQGGFEMEEEKIKTVSIEDIVLVIDEEVAFTMCVLGLKKCSEENPCPVHHKYKLIKADLKQMIKTTTIFDMVEQVNDGHSFLKIFELEHNRN
ncbi:MAG: Rrf2 family transcriptional regulator [Crocinitomicaceae bacterium]|nr:Rrf2 family transcriptional regulator [Crocinitomicaceae bacterium]